MGKNKLKKFREMETIDCVMQVPFGVLDAQGFPLRGHWHEDYFHNDNPIIIELGCGKGEYTVGMARLRPDCNYIGIDIKGARMWTGACQARDEGLTNVAFLRTNIELLPAFFAPGEVAEIWITFPDPQMKKVRKRLTSTRFMELYRQVMRDRGVVHLKTDSPFLYTYTRAMTSLNGLEMEADTDNLYESQYLDDVLSIRTYYEQQWLSRGLPTKYLAWHLPGDGELEEPQEDIPYDTYRSFSRGYLETHPTGAASLNAASESGSEE
ncbi:MAG: tRNA (guanosine(46)-N7)-methyltransferase TrmB [Bacteroidales bacterium]|nr:tRNA (guanosine(46)-N7)-methyltransferase TrmB [Bacteroidales bacterium]